MLKKQSNKKHYFEGIGRRKEAVCRLRLYISDKGEIKVKETTIKKGEIFVNGLPIEAYFPGKLNKSLYLQPFILTNSENRFAVSAHISGGGVKGQLLAFRLASARALEKANADYREILKQRGLLSVDSRVKERRKAGYAGKARKKRQSPKR